MTLEDLRAQAMDDLTPEQLRAASDAALLLCGWTTQEPEIDVRRECRVRDWISPEGENVLSDRPHAAASRDDSATLMPEGYRIIVQAKPLEAKATWGDPWWGNPETARREPYARMLAAVAAHMEDKT